MQQKWKNRLKHGIAATILIILVVSMWLAEHPTEVYQRKPLPDMALTTLEGKPFKLQDWQGPLIVNLFASWCTPCTKELPQLKELSKHLPVYGIAWQDEPEALKNWLEKYQPAFTDIGMENGTELLWKLRINGIPTTMVLDREHRIIYVHEGMITDADIAEFLPHIYDHK